MRATPALLALWLLAPAACAKEPHAPPPATDARADVERLGHLTLPPGAVVLQSQVEAGIDAAVFAKLKIAAASRDALVRAAGFSAPLSTTERRLHDHTLPQSWWKPDELAPFESGEVTGGAGKRRWSSHLLLGPAEPGFLTVYLFVTSL